jgi:hypothetical protein
MTGEQNAVLWVGLILIGLNLILQWPTIKKVLFTNTSGHTPSSIGGILGSGSGTVNQGGAGQIGVGPGSITVPFGGMPITLLWQQQQVTT